MIHVSNIKLVAVTSMVVKLVAFLFSSTLVHTKSAKTYGQPSNRSFINGSLRFCLLDLNSCIVLFQSTQISNIFYGMFRHFRDY